MSDGVIFYVGKGTGRRAYEKHNRSEWWKAVERKHGVMVDFYIEGTSDDYAKYIEVKLIAKFIASGIQLVNLTSGGDGTSGWVHSDVARRSIRQSNNPKTVYSSMGDAYDGLLDAEIDMKSKGYQKASKSNISYACSGKISSAYGRAWSYDWFPDHPEVMGRDMQKANAAYALAKPVGNDLGESFPSAMEAQRWLRSNGYPKATNSSICACISGRVKSAYGRKWFRA